MYRVLLVDDDPHIQAANEAYLKKQGYQVYRADNGSDALAIATTAALDAMVLDVDMPDMDGVSVCRRFRELSRVPVIFLSAYAQTDDRIRGLMAGGDDYLGKPYSLVELELRLRLRIQRRVAGGGEDRREGSCACVSSATSMYPPETSSGSDRWKSTWACGRCAMRANPPFLPPWSLICWPFWPKTPGRSFPTNSSTPRCGGPPSIRGCTTSRCVWPGSGRSWSGCAPICTTSKPCAGRGTGFVPRNGHK